MPFLDISSEVGRLLIEHVYIGNPNAKPFNSDEILTFEQIDELIEDIEKDKNKRTFNGLSRHVVSVVVVVYHKKQPTCAIVYASGIREIIKQI
jgi:hypothetical protein